MDVRAIVVANGVLGDPAAFGELFATADRVVAADGGASALLRSGYRVDALVGDFDSLDADLLAEWDARGRPVRRFPAEKDETDLELALRDVVECGATRIVILGGLGGRLDHELANVLLLAAPLLEGVQAELRGARTRAIAIRRAATLSGEAGDLLSLLPLTQTVEGVRTTGLAYPLRGESLRLGPPRGVSNVFTEATAAVTLSAGVLIAVHSWTQPRPHAW